MFYPKVSLLGCQPALEMAHGIRHSGQLAAEVFQGEEARSRVKRQEAHRTCAGGTWGKSLSAQKHRFRTPVGEGHLLQGVTVKTKELIGCRRRSGPQGGEVGCCSPPHAAQDGLTTKKDLVQMSTVPRGRLPV